MGKTELTVKQTRKRGVKRYISLILALSMIMSLFVMPQISASADDWDATWEGSGTREDPYLIQTEEDLWALKEADSDTSFEGEYFKVTSHLDMSDYTWTGISYFKGNFDGDGYFIDIGDNATCGLIDTLVDGSVSNVWIEGTINTTVSEGNSLGGVVGYNNDGSVFECYSMVDIYCSATTAYVGGVVGRSFDGSVFCCIYEGMIEVDDSYSGNNWEDLESYVGGIIGYFLCFEGNSWISRCYATTGLIEYEDDWINFASDETERQGILVGYYEDATGNDYDGVTDNYFISDPTYDKYGSVGVTDSYAVTEDFVTDLGDYYYQYDTAGAHWGYPVLKCLKTVQLKDTTLPSGKVGVSYSNKLSAINNLSTDVRYTITGMPSGMGLTTYGTGLISGTPNKAGEFALNVRVADWSYYGTMYSYETVVLTIDKGTPVFSGPTEFTKEYGKDNPFSLEQSVSGGGGLYYSSSDAEVVTVDENGIVTINGDGTAYVTVSVAESDNYLSGIAENRVKIVVNSYPPDAPTLDSAERSGSGAVDLKWSAPEYTGSTAISNYIVSWTPADAGGSKEVGNVTETTIDGLNNRTNYAFTVAAKNSAGTGAESAAKSSTPYADVEYPSKTLKTGVIDQPYSDSVATATGGLGSYTYAITSGTLPDGLTMSADGKITGMPTAEGWYEFDVTVTDSSGQTKTTRFEIGVVKTLTFSGGMGTQEDPYRIASATDLRSLASIVNGGETYEGKYFKLTANINLGGQSNPWVPIGDSGNTCFSGNFDGNGYAITNMYISGNFEFNGLFGHVVDGATITNLRLENGIIQTGDSCTGGLIGETDGSCVTIKNCYIDVDILADGGGGVIGTVDSDIIMFDIAVAGDLGTSNSAGLFHNTVYGSDIEVSRGYFVGKAQYAYIVDNSTEHDNAIGGIYYIPDNCASSNVVGRDGYAGNWDGIVPVTTTMAELRTAAFVSGKLNDEWNPDAWEYISGSVPYPRGALRPTVIKTDADVYTFNYGGASQTMGAKAYAADDSGNATTTATAATLTRQSSNTNTATVSGDAITPVNAGDATITITAAAKAGYQSATKTVDVKVNKIAPTFGGKEEFYKTYENPVFNLEQTVNSGGTLSYESQNPDIAEVDGDGNVTIKAAGTAKIRVTAEETANYTGDYRDVPVYIAKANPDWSNLPEKIELTIGGDDYVLNASVEGGGDITYTTDNACIEINDNIVTAKTVGEGNITATAEETANYTTSTKTISFVVNPTVPDAPTLESTASGDSEITLIWKAPEFDGGSDITNYVVYYSVEGSTEETSKNVGDVTSATITGLENRTTYSFRVAAENNVGIGEKSNSLSATPYMGLTYPSKVLATGVIDKAYSDTVATATGGLGSYTYEVTSGSLPDGLTIAPNGEITGTPKTAETKTFTVTATDSSGLTANAEFSIGIVETLEYGGGTGDKATPYLISTVQHMRDLATIVNGGEMYSGKYFKMTNDIDLGCTADNPWTPIGNDIIDNSAFKGNFDGNGYKISNLYLYSSESSSVSQGLFGMTKGGSICNLRLSVSGVKVDGPYSVYVGGLVGNQDAGYISSCYVDITSVTDSIYCLMGGLVGYSESLSIYNCMVTGDVGTNSGGICYEVYYAGGSTANVSASFAGTAKNALYVVNNWNGDQYIDFYYNPDNCIETNVIGTDNSGSSSGRYYYFYPTTDEEFRSPGIVEKLETNLSDKGLSGELSGDWEYVSGSYPYPTYALRPAQVTTDKASYELTYGGEGVTVDAKSLVVEENGSNSEKLTDAVLEYNDYDTDVISVSNGTITPVNGGSTKITVKSPATTTYRSATKEISVNVNKATTDIVKFSSDNYVGYPGKTVTVAATADSGNAIEYSSSDTSVATVDKDTGVVTGIKYGTVTITAKTVENRNFEIAEATATVNVERNTPEIKVENGTIIKNYGDDDFDAIAEANVTVEFEGAVVDIPVECIKSSDPNVVKIDEDSKKLTITGVGEAEIDIKSEETDIYNSVEEKAAIFVKVNTVKPHAPEFEVVSGEDSQIPIRWTEPEFNGGKEITGYVIERSEDNAKFSVIKSAESMEREYIDKDVVNGKTYYYRMYAKNSESTSEASETKEGKAYTIPGTPVEFAAKTTSNASIALTWKAPESDGGDAITEYVVNIYSDEACTNPVEDATVGEILYNNADSTYTTAVIGLAKGTKYYFTATAKNNAGKGEIAKADATTWDNTSKPQNTSSKATAEGTISLAWEAPEFDGGTPVTSYTVSYRVKGTEEWIPISGITALTYDVTGLTTKTTYEFKVTAINESGSTDGDTVEEVCAWIPDAPAIGDVVSKNASALITSIENIDNNGDDVTKFIVYYREKGTEEYSSVEIEAVDEKVTDVVVSALENGKEYEIVVSAVNTLGESDQTEVETVLVGLPTTPQNVKILPQSNMYINIDFDDADGQGNPITEYEIYIGGTVEGIETEAKLYSVAESEYLYNASERINGDTITAYVIAKNSVGVSEATEVVTYMVGTPSAPEITELSVTDAGVNVVWSAASANGNAKKNYNVYIVDSEGNEQKFSTADGAALAMDITTTDYAFEAGKTYTAYVTLVNSIGEGQRSEGKAFTFGIPQAPVIEGTEPGDGSLTVRWSKPANDGGSSIIGYNIYLNKEATPIVNVTWEAVGETTYQLYVADSRKNGAKTAYGDVVNQLDTFEIVIDNLANGDDYTVSVSAINANGEGPVDEPEDDVTPATKADTPRDVVAATDGITTASVSWNAPYYDGGSAVTGYYVVVYKTAVMNYDTYEYDAIERTKAYEAETTDKYINDIALEAGCEYVFEVQAINAMGMSDAAESKVIYTKTKPTKPVITDLVSGLDEDMLPIPLTVKWSASEGATSYDVFVNGNKINSEKIAATADAEMQYTIMHTGLIYGEIFTVQVRTYNEVTDENGVVSDTETIKIGTVSAPKNVNAYGDTAGKLTVTWTPYTDAETVPYVYGYAIYLNGTLTSIVEGSDTAIWEKELCVPGTVYEIQVATVNVNRIEGNKSDVVTVTMGTPSVVTDVTAVPFYESAIVTWNAETLSGDYAITGYNVYVDGVKNNTDLVTETDYTISNLEGGQEYEVTVTAVNAYGEGSAVPAVTVMPWSKPDAPIVKDEDIVPGIGTFSFTFSTPDGNGAEITGYKVYVDNALDEDAIINGNTATVNDVVDGTEHTFYVIAANAQGLESDVPTEPYRVITGVPAAPSNVKVVAGSDSITVTFDKSVGIDATSYVVTWGNGESAEITADDSEQYTYTITDLTIGEEYTITVKGRNAQGDGPESTPVMVTTGTPLAPEITKVTSDNGKLDVEWTEPEANAGEITKYTVYVDGIEAKTTSKTSATISGLKNGKAYVITVCAENYIGKGMLSEPATGTPGTIPGSVADAEGDSTYENNDFIINLTWNEPTDNGGLPITDYIIEGEGTITVDSANRTAKVTGLEKGTEYTYTITVINSAGEGEEASVTVTTPQEPDAPELTEVDGANCQITAMWTAPELDGGMPITEYILYAEMVNGDETLTKSYKVEDITANENGEYTGEIIEAVQVGEKYSVTVVAVNAVGNSEQSNDIRVTTHGEQIKTVPGTVKNVEALSGDTYVTINWEAPAYDGNSAVTSYNIKRGTSPEDMLVVNSIPADDYTEVDGKIIYTYKDEELVNDTTYYYAVNAVNAVGEGVYSDAVSATPSEIAAPTAPEWVDFDNTNGVSAYEADSSGTKLVLTWNASEGTEEGGDITYEIYVNDSLVDTITETSYELTGLNAVTEYEIQVVAVNAIGKETSSDKMTAYTTLNVRKDLMTSYPPIYNLGNYAYIDADYDGKEDNAYKLPAAPMDVVPDVKADKITWKAPTDKGNPEPTVYNIYVNAEKLTYNIASEVMPISEEGYSIDYDFDTTVSYEIYVAAENEYGEEGDPSATIYINPTLTPPSELVEKEISEENVITLEWTAPENVTEYVLYINGAPEDITATVVDGKATYEYAAEADQNYVFAVAAKYGDSLSVLSNFIEVAVGNPPESEKTVTDLAAELNKDKTTVTLTWTETEGVTYYLIVNGEEQNEAVTSGYVYTIPEDSADNIIFAVRAEKTNDDGTTESSISNYCTVNLDEITESGPAIITRYISNGLSNVKVFWQAPERLEGEKGYITEYGIVVDGVEESRVSAEDAHVYEIGFDSMEQTKEVYIIAYKISGETTVPVSQSETWTVTPSSNIVENPEDYPNPQEGEIPVTRPDKDGDGKVDLEEPTTIEIQLADFEGNYLEGFTVDFIDAQTETILTSAISSINGDGKTVIELNLDDISATAEINISISKSVYTSYTITNISCDEIEGLAIINAETYIGDLNNTGDITATDRIVLNRNIGLGNATVEDGDLNNTGDITATDRIVLNRNVGKTSIETTWDNYKTKTTAQ